MNCSAWVGYGELFITATPSVQTKKYGVTPVGVGTAVVPQLIPALSILSSSVYTRDVNVAMRAMNELDTGITYINAPTIGAEAHLPFGGVKQTGNGHREGGWEVYEFYSETKVGYLDFSGALQRAQIDNYLGTPD